MSAEGSSASARPSRRFSSRVRLLQRIDRWAGIPLCFALTLWRRASDVFRPADFDAPPRRILLLKLTEQGSTVLAHDAIRRAVELVGKENVFFAVFEENRAILDILGLVSDENVLAIRTTSAAAMARSTRLALRRMRHENIDTCIDLEFFARSSAALGYLSGARRRIGFHARFGEGPYRGDLQTHRVAYNPHVHTATAFRSLVEASLADPTQLPTFGWRSQPPPLPPSYAIEPHETAAVDAARRDLGVPSDAPVILLNANAGDLLPLRKWPEENYVTLAQRLAAEFPPTHILFTGGPEEAARTAELAAATNSPRCHSIAGRTTLRELLALYHRATVLVTNDSGPAHFAALTPIEVVVLFGPETPLLFAAPGPRTHVVWSGLACSPCVSALNNRQSVCRDNICMRTITVDEVHARVAALHRARR